MNIEKRSCLARANALLLDPTHENLLYAALQLRLCMESLTYEKLRTYADIIPPSILETWQPPQAVKALLAFEPNADQSFSLRIGRQDKVGEPAKEMKHLGEHKSLKLAWLKKHYHKIGNYLHAPSITSKPLKLQDFLAYLKEVAADLVEPVNSSILNSTLREVFVFNCEKCKNLVVGNKKVILSEKEAICFNPQCGAKYFADVTDVEKPVFQLMATKFECTSPNCNGEITLENRKLDIGVIFKCPTCGLKHEIMERQWGYSP